MPMYNLKVTNRQSSLIQYHIIELCNYMLNGTLQDVKVWSNNFANWEEYDIHRACIYFKQSKLNKSYYIYKGLTKQEIKFISSELNHWCINRYVDADKIYEKPMAKRIIDNINKSLDIQLQRDIKINQILDI